MSADDGNSSPNPTQPLFVRQLEAVFKLEFHHKPLLKQALVHTSYANEQPVDAPESNERLEFLGDALLDFVVAMDLYRRHPYMTEGDLTMARSALVSEQALAKTARRIGLGEYLFLGQGEEGSRGRERDSILSGGIEALMGAVLVDQGYQVASDFVLNLLEPEIKSLTLAGGATQDFKSQLQEWVQGNRGGAPVYRMVSEFGPDHAKQFSVEVLVDGVVVGAGIGSRKSSAERAAAEIALTRLRSETDNRS